MTGSPNMLPFLQPSRPGEVGGVWPCSQKSWLRRRYRIGSALALAVLLLCAAGESLAQSEMPVLTIGDPTVEEDGGMANFEVTLNTAVSGGFTVAVSTTDGTATADEDFTAVSAQTLSFAGMEGETKEFTVDITDDSVVEGDETFTVGLSGLSGTGEAVDITGTATITDNDFASVLFLDVFLVVAEDEGMATITVQLDGEVQDGFEITFSAGHETDTAEAGSDYTGTLTTVMFEGTLDEEQEFDVRILDDQIVEDTEFFAVELSSFSRPELEGVDIFDIEFPVLVEIEDNDTATVTFNSQSVTVDEDAGTVTVTAVLDNGVQDGFEVTVSTEDGTAEARSDYMAVSAQTLSFEGEPREEQTFTVNILNDEMDEGTEMFGVFMSLDDDVLPEITASDTAPITIIDDDRASVTFNSQSVTVEEGAGMVTVTAVLSKRVQDGFEVTVSTEDGTAEAGSDYTAVSAQTLSFEGEPSEEQTFTVDILNGEIVEGTEMFGVSMSPDGDIPFAITISDTATITITDDDRASVLFLDSFPVVSEGAGMATVTVLLDGGVQDGFEITFSTEDEAAEAGSDYTETSTTLTFAGTLNEEQEFPVPIHDDQIVEDAEFFHVNPSGFSRTGLDVFVDFPLLVEIEENDTATVTFNSQSVMVNEGAGTVTVTAVLDKAVQDSFEVTVSTEAGTAEAVRDYAETFMTLTFEGRLNEEQTFIVDIVNDEIVEGAEMFDVLVHPDIDLLFYITTDDTATVTIIDDDIAPTGILLALDPMSVTEGSGGGTSSTEVTVTVSFTGSSATLISDVVVMVSVAGGTATAGGTDFNTVTSFPVTILEGETSGTGTFQLEVVGDTLAEGEETVTVSGTSDLPVAAATLTITDDDEVTGVGLSLVPDSVAEGDSGTATTQVTVTARLAGGGTRTAATVVAVTVAGGTATGAGTDFADVPGFMVTIPATQISGERTFQLVVAGDTLAEGDETLTVSGSADLPVAAATLTITDDDTAPTGIALSLSRGSTYEATSQTVTVTASFTGSAAARPVATEVAVTVAGGTAMATGAGRDFADVPGFTVTIPATQTRGEGTFQLVVLGDMLVEGDETITVSGSADLGGGGPAATATAELTITDDDEVTGIRLSLVPGSVAEGDSGTATTQVTVTARLAGGGTRTAATAVVVTVAGGTATGAGTDFVDVPGFTVTIPATQISGEGTFQLVVLGDMLVEGDETITVSGSADLGGGGPAATATADLTITDDDEVTGIALSLSRGSTYEATSQTVTVTASFTGSAAARPVATEVAVTVAGGTAMATGAGTDFADVPGFTVTIPATQTRGEGTFQLVVLGDMLVEGDETITVSGSADLPVAAATLTITDDDEVTGIGLSLVPGSVAEGDSGTATTQVTVTARLAGGGTRTAATAVAVTVAGGTATGAGTDFADVPGFTVTIPATQISGEGTFQLVVAGDTLAEGDETVTVSGSADLPVAAATLTITDDDTAPTGIALSLSRGSTYEATSQTVTVTASFTGSAAARPVATEVAVTVAGGTAMATGADTDFADVPGFTVTIPATQTRGEGTFQLVVLGDMLVEGDETITVSGSADLPVAAATLTITDDDEVTGIGLSLVPDSVAEGDSGTATTQVTVTARLAGGGTRTAATAVVVTVAGGTATGAGTDFVDVPGFTVTIPATQLSGEGTFQLEVVGDTLVEGNKTVTVSGSADLGGGGPAATATADLTITDDDEVTGIALSLSPDSVAEGDSGTATTEVTVTARLAGGGTRTAATAVAVTVAGGTATGAGTDFADVTGFTISIPAGTTSFTDTFSLEVAGDTRVEGNETVTVSGTADLGGGGPAATATADLTITDDDEVTGIGLSLSPDSVAEGDSGTATTEVTVTARLAGGGTRTATTEVAVTVAGGTATGAGTDFADVTGFTISIPAGTTSFTDTFSLEVAGDTLAEGNETVTVSGSADLGGGGPAATATADLTITDDDDAPTEIVLTLSQDRAIEGSSPTVTVTAALSPDTITLPEDTVVTVAVGAATDSATEGTDYTTVGDLTLTIAGGSARGMGEFSLVVTDDTTSENGGETVTVSGTTATPGFTDGVTAATLTIADYDQVAVAVSLGNVGVGEESGTVTVTATLNAAVEGGFGIEASTVEDGTATAGSDYTAVSGHPLVFAGSRGEERTFTVTILNDTDAEGEAETFTVSLSAPDAAVTLVALTSGTVWITDDDTPTVTLGDETVEEGAGTVTVTATLSLAVSGGFTVEAVTADGTAAAGSDYTAVSAQTLSFTGTEGETREFTVDITDDSDVEGDETFTVSLDNLASTTTTVLTGDTSTVTITDDAPATSMTEITLSLDPVEMAETIGTATVSVTASVPADGARARATEVAVTVEGDTAVAGEDFAPVPTFTITIAPDEASGTGAFMLTVAAADGREGAETLIVSGRASGFAVVPVTQTIMDETAGALESVGVELARETLAGVSSAVAARVSHRLAGRLPAPAGNLDFPGSLARGLAANRQALNDGSRSWRELLDRSSFEFRTGEDPDGFPLSDSPSSRSPDIGLWAAAEGRRLSNDDSELGDYDGRLFFAHVGADIPIGRGLAGLALSSSRGSFDFERDEFDSDTRLLNYSLYAGVPVGEAGSLRATVGYGTGEIETGQSGDRDTRDITMTMGILGGRTRVAAKDGLSLDVDGELWAGHLKSDSAGGIGNFALDTRRLQLGLDLAKTWRRDSGAQITQAAKLDLRQDGGDGETGSGAGIEGRLGYINPAASLTATVTGDFLLFHESGLEGGGVGGSVLYRPDTTGRGLSFRTDTSYTAGREDISRLWRDSEVVDSTDASEAAVLGLETGYGLPALGGYALLTPYYAFEFTRKDARHHRLGGRLQVRGDLELELEGGHRGNVPDHDSERRLDLRVRMTW